MQPKQGFLELIIDEFTRAKANYPPMRSYHEGLAILQEEVFELQQEVYLKPYERDRERMLKEAVQVAAMAWRFAEDNHLI